MQQLLAPRTVNYPGKDKSVAKTNEGEELAISSSAIELRRTSRSWEG